VVAAGPWFCAEGSVALATGRCLTRESAPPVEALVDRARRGSARGELDPLSSLAASRAYISSGSKDTRVVPALGADLARFYAAFVPAAQLVHRRDVPAGHAMVTEDFGGACDAHALPFINDCDLDLAGEILKHLHGPLAPRNEGAPAGRYLAFDQRAFVAEGRGMGSEGRLYVPAACEGGGLCGVHVVLHGCGQNVDLIGEDYVRRTGYARWADTNRLVLLFPQTSRDAINACWDWWGYTGVDYARKSAPQMGAIVAMVEHLAAVAAPCTRAFNSWHAWAGRALWDAFGTTRAAGSGQRLGAWWQRTALRESPRGFFTLAEAC
jgi:hypothetical protein